MKKLLIPVLVTTVGLSTLSLNQAIQVQAEQNFITIEEQAEQNLLQNEQQGEKIILQGEEFVSGNSNLIVEMNEKEFKVSWNDFKSMLNGEFNNHYKSVLNWAPILVNKEVADSYKVTFKRLLEDGTWKSYNYTTKATTFVVPFVLSAGMNYEYTIIPKKGNKYYDAYSIKEKNSVPTVSEQASPVTFDGYVSQQQAVKALITNLRLKSSYERMIEDYNGVVVKITPEQMAEVSDNIKKYITMIYINSGYASSLEFINNPEATNDLLDRAENHLSRFDFESYKITSIEHKMIIAELLAIYNNDVETNVDNIALYLELIEELYENESAYDEDNLKLLVNMLVQAINQVKSKFPYDFERLLNNDALNEKQIEILKSIYLTKYENSSKEEIEKEINNVKELLTALGAPTTENPFGGGSGTIFGDLRTNIPGTFAVGDVLEWLSLSVAIAQTNKSYYDSTAGKQVKDMIDYGFGNGGKRSAIEDVFDGDYDIWGEDGYIGKWTGTVDYYKMNDDMDNFLYRQLKKWGNNKKDDFEF